MNTNQPEPMESASPAENSLDAGRPAACHRGYVLGILIVAILIAELSKDLIFSTDRGDWSPACTILYYGMIACLPFLLARMAPVAAGFDTQWFPISRWQWLWFLGMFFLLILSKLLVCALATAIISHPLPRPSFGSVTPMGIVFRGIAMVFVAPVAEEIFFRGFVLEQLRKLARSWNALWIQALLFGLFHLYAWGLFTSVALILSVFAFVLGMIAGMWRIKFRSLLPLVLTHVLFNATAIAPLKAGYDQAVDRSHPKYTISKETTSITEPLRKDGAVDYVAALNKRYSRGVTPENNAAVLFWKAMGLGEINEKYREKYFQMLGILALPEKGDYFIDVDQYAAQKDIAKPGGTAPEKRGRYESWDQLNRTMKRPWSNRDFPIFAEWLAANEKPLALLGEASKRPRCYDPLVGGETTPLVSILRPDVQLYKSVAGALAAQAMLRLGEGKLDAAWEDLLTCHRLAQLTGQGPTLIDALMAQTINERACAGDQALLQHTRLIAAQVAKMRRDLNRLPPLPNMADRIDVAERFTYLELILYYARWGSPAVAEIEKELAAVAEIPGIGEPNEAIELKDVMKSLVYYRAGTAIDWDVILRMGNAWFDRIADAYHKPTRAEQKEALRRIDEDLRGLKKAVADTTSLDKAMLDNPRKALSERLGQVLLSEFSPSIRLDTASEDRAIMRFELDKLAFALTAYQADVGSFPAKLAELAPKYVAELPKDRFNEADLHYRRQGAGFLLYSVGMNGKDDQGRSMEDRKKGEDWDDLVVHVPAPAVENEKR